MSFGETAIPLVEIINGKLHVKKETYEILEAIDEKVIVIAISGLPQVGKSSLLNWLIDKQNCFPNALEQHVEL